MNTPPAAVGMRPSFVMSKWTRSPGWECSCRFWFDRDARMRSPVMRSDHARFAIRWRVRMRLMVGAGTPVAAKRRGAEAEPGPGLENGLLSCRAGRGLTRTARSIDQPCLALVPGLPDPSVGALRRDAELAGDVRRGSAIPDALDEQRHPVERQTGDNEGPRDLLVNGRT